MRKCVTGATRDTDVGKLDYEAFLSPLALQRYGKYLHKHRLQEDGTLRAGDNWQKGIPQAEYMKSLWRHLMAVWSEHRGWGSEEGLEDALCGVLFNAQGMLHETLKAQEVWVGRAAKPRQGSLTAAQQTWAQEAKETLKAPRASRRRDDHVIHTQLHRFAALKTKRDTLAARLDELDHTPCAWELPLAKSVKKGAKRP